MRIPVLSLFTALIFLIPACDKEKVVMPQLPYYEKIQGNEQSGYFLETLKHPISVDITNPAIERVAFVVTKGGGEVLIEEFEKGKTYFTQYIDSITGHEIHESFSFVVNSFTTSITLPNKWLLGCEAENELTVFLFESNNPNPVDTLVFTALAKKREIWNRACGLEVAKTPFDYPTDFTFVGGKLTMHPNGDIWVLRPYPVYRSTDQGKSFEPIYDDLLETNQLSVTDAAISPTGRIFFGTNSNGIIISDDKGVSWKYANQGISGYNTIRDIVFLSDTECLCHSVNGIFYSNNGGNSWTKLTVSYTNYLSVGSYISAVKINNVILMVDEWRNLIKSTDNGITWKLLTGFINDSYGLRELVKYDNAVYAVTERGGKYVIFKSSDIGANWVKVSENDCYTWVNSNNLSNPSRLFYVVDRPGNPLYDAKSIFYTDVNGEKGTLVDSIPDMGFTDFIVLPGDKMILAPSQKGGVVYN